MQDTFIQMIADFAVHYKGKSPQHLCVDNEVDWVCLRMFQKSISEKQEVACRNFMANTGESEGSRLKYIFGGMIIT